MGWPSPQGILDNVAAYYLVILLEAAVAYMLARWVKRFHDLTPPVLAILVIALFGLVMWTINHAVTLHQWWTRPTAKQVITSATPDEELAHTIQQWLDNFHVRYQVKDREEMSFSFTVQTDDAVSIEIVKPRKTYRQFIILLSHVVLDPESQTKIKSLPASTQQWIFDQVSTELLRQNVSMKGDLFSGIHIELRVPISELTEGQLMDRLDKMYSVVTLVRLKLRSYS